MITEKDVMHLGFLKKLPFKGSDQGMRFLLRSAKDAEELLSNITIGWNLGNTLDSWNNGGPGPKTELDLETYWGNPETTKAMIDTVRKAGFNTVRIPVSWGDHIDASGNISKEWLDRVQEVVNYAYDGGMFVIINTHHDESWMKFDKSGSAKSIKMFKNVWKQISARFKNYNQRLIFEGLNEPRIVGTPNEWGGGTAEEREIINEYHKAFIETVRSSGGNNKTRLLLLTPHGAKEFWHSMSELYVPTDDKMVAVSIHPYVPGEAVWGESYKFDDNSKQTIDNTFNAINDLFLSKGISVVVTEYGTSDKKNTSDRVKHAEYYLSTATKYGIPCCWWDTGDLTLLNRNELKWNFSNIVKTIINNASKSPFTSKGKLAAPTGFKASRSQTEITLTWNSVKGADAYRVYRYNEKTGKYVKYKDVSDVQCTITGLKKNTKYKFKVTPLTQNSNGEYVKHTNTNTKTATTKK